jgi:hypothetical protein
MEYMSILNPMTATVAIRQICNRQLTPSLARFGTYLDTKLEEAVIEQVLDAAAYVLVGVQFCDFREHEEGSRCRFTSGQSIIELPDQHHRPYGHHQYVHNVPLDQMRKTCIFTCLVKSQPLGVVFDLTGVLHLSIKRQS